MTKPARVAIVISSLRGGGAERAVVAMIRGLDRDRFEPLLIVNEAVGELVREVEGLCPLEVIGARNINRALPRLASILRRAEPDLVVSHLWQWNVLVGATRFLTRAAWPHIAVEHSGLSRRSWLSRRLTHGVLARADAVVAVSEGMAAELRDLHGAAAVVAVPNPIVGGVTSPARVAAGGEGFEVIAIGHLRVEKRYDVLLRAMAKLPRDTRLRIAGEGALRSDLEALIVELGLEDRVALLGYVQDVSSMFEADLFVLTSDSEGLPTALIEAVLAGVPAVATNCEHGPSEILLGGDGGVLVPTGDPEAVAQAIAAVREDYDAALARASVAAEAARARYSLEATMARMQRLMGDCIRRRREGLNPVGSR